MSRGANIEDESLDESSLEIPTRISVFSLLWLDTNNIPLGTKSKSEDVDEDELLLFLCIRILDLILSWKTESSEESSLIFLSIIGRVQASWELVVGN